MTPLMCLAVAVFFEARNEPIDAQYAVAEVIVNRVAHEKFPDNVCDVVYDGAAFSFTHDGKSDDMKKYTDYADKNARAISIAVASDVLTNGNYLGLTATHYHADYVKPFWSDHKDFIFDGKLGTHIFYTCENYC